MFSINGIVIKYFIVSSMAHNVNLCPLLNLGITFRSILNLDTGLKFKFILVCNCLVGGFHCMLTVKCGDF